MKYKNCGEPTIIHKNILYNCDCVELLKETPDKYYELAIVDPPYGIERLKTIGKGDLIHSEKDIGKNYNNEKPNKEYFDELFRVSKNQIIWGANNFELPTSEYFLIWDKQQFYPNFARCEMAWVGGEFKKPAKIFTHSVVLERKDKIHPTQKPVALYKWLLKNYAKEGDKILDTHLGSMSIAIACHYMGFSLTGCELDKEYFDAGVERVRNQTRQETLL